MCRSAEARAAPRRWRMNRRRRGARRLHRRPRGCRRPPRWRDRRPRHRPPLLRCSRRRRSRRPRTPYAASRSQWARPMPRPPPVTTTTRPSSGAPTVMWRVAVVSVRALTVATRSWYDEYHFARPLRWASTCSATAFHARVVFFSPVRHGDAETVAVAGRLDPEEAGLLGRKAFHLECGRVVAVTVGVGALRSEDDSRIGASEVRRHADLLPVPTSTLLPLMEANVEPLENNRGQAAHRRSGDGVRVRVSCRGTARSPERCGSRASGRARHPARCSRPEWAPKPDASRRCATRCPTTTSTWSPSTTST